MNRFIKIFETALSDNNQEVTATDVDDVLTGFEADSDSEDVTEDSTTGSVAGFSPKAFQATTNKDKLLIAQMLADAIAKACEFGNDKLNTTDDTLEELKTLTPRERMRLRNYARRNERLGRDPLGKEGLKLEKLPTPFGGD